MYKQYEFPYSMEEHLAFEFYIVISKFNSKLKGCHFSKIDKSILGELNFEIVNNFYNKNVLISYVLRNNTNIKKVELALKTIGIDVKFSDKSDLDKKRYLVIWK
jgi:hypothetical protein